MHRFYPNFGSGLSGYGISAPAFNGCNKVTIIIVISFVAAGWLVTALVKLVAKLVVKQSLKK